MSVSCATRVDLMSCRAITPASPDRRRALARGSALATLFAGGLFSSTEVRAAGEEVAFAATSVPEALRALGGVQAVDSEIVLTVPDSAENGAIVPVSVSCTLAAVQEIFIVVDTNPNPLVVRFSIPDGTEPFVATRVKVAESGTVYAVVRAGGTLYSACRQTQVTIGGCA